MVCLTHDEWEALYAAVGQAYSAFLRFLVGTGCRWGEAVVLRVKDIDLSARTIKIRRALKWSPSGDRVIGPPKTKKGKRTIAAPSEVIEDLRPLIEGKPGNALVFEQARGGMLNHRNFWSRYWKPATWRAQQCDTHRAEWVAAGCKCGTTTPARCSLHRTTAATPCGCKGTLTQTPRIHDLRHTHASWLLAEGVPIHVVQARLGHESIQTTVDTYSHLLPDAQLLAADAASMAFSGRRGGGSWVTRVDSLSDDALRQLAAAVILESQSRGLSAELIALPAGTAA
jgi:integrase